MDTLYAKLLRRELPAYVCKGIGYKAVTHTMTSTSEALRIESVERLDGHRANESVTRLSDNSLGSK